MALVRLGYKTDIIHSSQFLWDILVHRYCVPKKKKKGRRTRSDQGDYNYEYFDLRNPLGNGNMRATTL